MRCYGEVGATVELTRRLSQHMQTQRLRDWDRKALVRWKQLQDAQRLRLEDVRTQGRVQKDQLTS